VELAGAVVAITGASAGIGRASALAFARAGARLALTARRAGRLQEVAAALPGTEVLVHPGDVAVAADVQAFVDAIVARFGRLDVLVNNAGFGYRGSVEATPDGAWRRMMDANFHGTVYGCQAAIPVMRRQGAGVIINVSSIVGHRAMPGGAAYAATKAAQVSLTEALRVELRDDGIAVCSVHPVGTTTEFGEVADRESGGRTAGAVGPQQTAEQVADAIVRCARRPRPEVHPHFLSRVLVVLNAVSPGFVDWWTRRAARKSGRL
jgi:NADP-dependent 3-hydroxy acid dehydrogenase YdfG